MPGEPTRTDAYRKAKAAAYATPSPATTRQL